MHNTVTYKFYNQYRVRVGAGHNLVKSEYGIFLPALQPFSKSLPAQGSRAAINVEP